MECPMTCWGLYHPFTDYRLETAFMELAERRAVDRQRSDRCNPFVDDIPSSRIAVAITMINNRQIAIMFSETVRSLAGYSFL